MLTFNCLPENLSLIYCYTAGLGDVCSRTKATSRGGEWY